MKYRIESMIFLLFAAALIISGTNCTAQPVDAGYRTGTDISDLVLIYHGSTHRPEWNSTQLKPYVYQNSDKGFHWMFDGFLFLEIFDKNRKIEWDPGFGHNTADKKEWEWLSDRYFSKGKGPDALESVLDSLALKDIKPLRKRKVVISIPDPVAGFTDWGEIDGRKLDFNNPSDQVTAACWFIDRILKMWEGKNYRHIQLDGFYWVHEAAGKDYQIIPEVKRYLLAKSMRLYWIPYWKAERSDIWKELGFDCAYQQPNYFFNKELSAERLNDACNFGKLHGMGMEMEFDNNVINPEGRKKYYEYISAFETNGVWEERQVAYYEGGGAWLKISQSTDPEMKKMADRLSSIVIKRQEMADMKFLQKKSK